MRIRGSVCRRRSFSTSVELTPLIGTMLSGGRQIREHVETLMQYRALVWHVDGHHHGALGNIWCVVQNAPVHFHDDRVYQARLPSPTLIMRHPLTIVITNSNISNSSLKFSIYLQIGAFRDYFLERLNAPLSGHNTGDTRGCRRWVEGAGRRSRTHTSTASSMRTRADRTAFLCADCPC